MVSPQSGARKIAFLFFCFVFVHQALPALVVTPNANATQLWHYLFPNPLPTGVTINSVTYTGYDSACGSYSNMPPINGIQPNNGLLMTSGKAVIAIGPNDQSGAGLDNQTAGDADLTTLLGGATTNDAAVLTIKFTTDTSVHGISFDFVFGSDEYPEYVGTSFNDVFGAFLDGTNISFDSVGNYISVNNNFFKIDNNTTKIIDLQMDGFTPLLRSSKPLSAGVHILKIAIADAGDHVLDSDLFLSNFKFSCSDTGTHPVLEQILLTPIIDTNVVGTIDTLTAKVQNIFGVPIVGRKVFFEILSGPHAGKKDSSITNSSGIALFAYQGVTPGLDEIVAKMKDASNSLMYSDHAFHCWKTTTIPPHAEAGPNRTIAARPACTAIDTLDGTGSSGTITAFSWTGPFGTLSAVKPIVTLPIGVNKIFLTVSNGVLSSTDSVFITVADSTAPVPNAATLPTIRGQCSVTLTPPTATDNCAGTITGATDSLTFTTQGKRTVKWTYSDGHGNTVFQAETVIVHDTIAPVVHAIDTTVFISAASDKAFIVLHPAIATDNCTPSTLQATRADGLPLESAYSIGTTKVTWKACDANANCDNAIQSVTIKRNRPPLLHVVADTTIKEKDALQVTITASDSDGTTPVISGSRLPLGCSVINNGNGQGLLSWNTGCNDHGVDTIRIKAFDGLDSTISQIIVTVIDVNFPPVFVTTTGEQHATQLKPFAYTAHAEDCDGAPLTLRAINAPSGATFTDNGNGTGTLLWTPQANQAGYYMIIFEAKDDATAVRDTVIVIVEDAARFAPTILVSSVDTTVGINLPLALLVRATSGDGTVPLLSATSLPSNATFVCDGDGNGVFSWTPHAVGKDSLKLLAKNVADPTLTTTCLVKITVSDKNVTGPVFLPHSDTAVDQKSELKVTVEAHDLDGATPELFQVSAPPGVHFVDNGNGTGTFSWKPGCDVSGNFTLRAGATDHYLADSISVGVEVRVVNFPPVFAPMHDQSAIAGEMVRILVSAADQCIGSTTPILSVSSELTGYTFETHGDGTGVFGWKAWGSSGSYPIIFSATNGIATASDTVMLSVNKSGTLIVTAQPKGARIHLLPSANYPGALLGTDSLCYCAKLGTYWFEVEAAGYRSTQVSCAMKADSVITQNVVLKPAIPLMIVAPDSFIADTALSAPLAGAFTFIDANGDGLVDCSFLSGQGLKTCYQFNNGVDSGFRSLAIDTAKRCEPIVSPVSHVFADWNNSGVYSCIVSTATGKILLLKPENGVFTLAETLCTVSGTKPYPMVMDIDRDGKKDLVVHSENVGVFVFPNTGTDSMPRLGPAREIMSSSGESLKDCKGPVLLMDMDQSGTSKWIIACGGVLKTFALDSSLSKLTYESDLNCGGSRFAIDSVRYALLGSPLGEPKLFAIKGKVVKVFSTRLCGDINGDGVVDIRDISKISKAWELIDKDPSWVPLYNLKLSTSGPEVIDIRDISRASKCWELKE